MTYNPADWYWAVAGSTTEVWSSKRVEYVAVSDETYVAWAAAGNAPTAIATAAGLFDVLLAQWLPSALSSSPVTLASSGTPALNGVYDICETTRDRITRLALGMAAGKPLPSGESTFSYADTSGSEHSFTGDDFLNFAAKVQEYLYSLQQAVYTRVTGGEAALPSTTISIA